MPDTENRDNTETTRMMREIEALLFAADEPLSLRRLSTLLGNAPVRALREGMDSLNRLYRANGRSFEIVEVAGGHQMTTLPEFADTVARLFKSRRKARLSKPALETLAIIAYKQPIGRIDIEQIRGVNCDGVLSTLVDRELIEVSGRGEGIGKPFLYSTTKKFLEYLGLKDYGDLPDMEELERGLEPSIPEKRPPASGPDGTERRNDDETENAELPGRDGEGRPGEE